MTRTLTLPTPSPQYDAQNERETRRLIQVAISQFTTASVPSDRPWIVVTDAPYLADNTGSLDATTAINAAADAADALGGATLFFPGGTYKVSAELYSGDNTAWLCDRDATTISAPAMSTLRVINAVDATGVTVEGFTMTGLFGVGVCFQRSEFCALRGCDISGGTTGDSVFGYALGAWLLHSTDCVIDGNYFHGNGSGNITNLSCDIQLNGSNYLGYPRNTVTNNRCTSTAVHMNIALYNTQESKCTGNICTGAFCRLPANNSGYGIMSYHSVPAIWSAATTFAADQYTYIINSDGQLEVYVCILGHTNQTPPNSTYWTLVDGPNRDVEISGNIVYDTEGCGIYCQGLRRGKVFHNTVRNTGTVQTETSLLSGAIGINGGESVSVSFNKCHDFAYTGITLTSVPDAVCVGNTVYGTLAAGKSTNGIWLRGNCTRVRVSDNDVANVSIIGIGTTTTAAVTTACIVTGNSVTSAGVTGIVLDTAISCAVSKNTVRLSGAHGINLTYGATSAGKNNVVTDNVVTDSSQSAANTYSHISIATPQTATTGNVMENLLSNGAKYGIAYDSTSGVGSVVVGNTSKNARTLDFNLPALCAQGGNVNTTNVGAFSLGSLAQFTRQGSDGNQLYLGNASIFGAVGTVQSSGDTFFSTNATHGPAGSATDTTWHQQLSSVRSVLTVMRSVAGNGTLEVYLAAAGTADATFATFWGTPVFLVDTTGNIKIGGTYVVKAQGAAVADVASADATDLATVITLANETKAQFNTWMARARAATGHGLVA